MLYKMLYSQTIIYSIILAILSCFSYIVAGALFVGIVLLVIRKDLVSQVIARELLRQQSPVVTPAEDVHEVDEWTNAAKLLAFEPVPPVVRIQMLIDRIEKYKTDQLDPLDKRLRTVILRLTKMMDKCHRARRAYDYETTELNALYALHVRQTMSIGTNTDNIENSTISKSTVVNEELESSKVTKVSIVEPPPQPLSKKSLSSDVKSGSKPPVEGTQLVSKSSVSVVSSTQPESLKDSIKELLAYFISVVLWCKNASTSAVYRRKAIKVYEAINSILKSQYLKTCFQVLFESFDTFVKFYTHLDMNDPDLTSVIIRIPATENDSNVKINQIK